LPRLKCFHNGIILFVIDKNIEVHKNSDYETQSLSEINPTAQGLVVICVSIQNYGIIIKTN
jgi:hypothetical protein